MKRLSMSAESMRAILAGKKDLTSRVVVPQPEQCGDALLDGKRAAITDWLIAHAPYHVGERVALTEVWSPWADELTKDVARASMFDDSLPVGPVIYAAEFVDGCSPLEVGGYGRWRPPFLMRAKDASVFVTITSVAAGRLWDMTCEDYVREGVETLSWFTGDLRAAYMEWWRRLNGKRYPSSMNPWTYHYGLRRESQ